MEIKFFVEAKEKNDAIKLVNDSLQEIDEILITKKEKKVISYWKMKDVYIVEFEIELYKEMLQCFLNRYSDVWIEMGYPVDELLASKNNMECKYMKNKFIMIDVFL